MAKIDWLKVNKTLKYIQNIAYLPALPTANEDSADFVSVNNVLYAKQVNNGVYSYAEIGGGGTTVIEKTLNEEGTDFIDTFTEEDIDKFIGGALLKVKVNEVASYYLTPMITQQTDEGVKGVGLGGFLDTQEGTMLMVNVMTMNGQIRTQLYRTEGFSSGGGGVEIITKTIAQTEPLTFTQDFTQEEFDKLYSGTALLRVWSIADTYGFILKPYIIQFNESMNTKGIRFEGFVDIEEGQYFNVDVIQQNGVFRTNIKQIDTKSGASEPTVINLNTYVPSTATNGTLDSSVLNTLQESDQNYIVFNNEIFKLADKQHNEGYLVYSHNGHDTTGCFFQKCITITLSTRGWVLEEQENASKSYVSEQITTAYGFDVSVDGETLVFDTIGNVLQGEY